MKQGERNLLRLESMTLNHEKALSLCRRIPTLLDALDEAEAHNNYLGFSAKEWHDKGVRVKEGLEKRISDYVIEMETRLEVAKKRADEAAEALLRVFVGTEHVVGCDNCPEKTAGCTLPQSKKQCVHIFAADRDRWKARAEALERVIKKVFSDELCNICQHKQIMQGGTTICLELHCEHGSHWQFDKARFAANDGSVE